MRQYETIYEQAVFEKFESDVQNGRTSPSELLKMYVEGRLSQYQLDILEEAGMLAGLRSAAGQIGQGVRQGVGNAVQGAANVAGKAVQGVKNAAGNVATAYNTGRNAQLQKNAYNQFVQEYTNKVAPALNQLKTTFNDKEITNAQINFAAWFKYLQGIIQRKYPNVVAQQAAQPQAPQNAATANPPVA